MLGADPEELDRLAVTFDRSAQTLERLRQQIAATVAASYWQGQEADRFRSEWSGRLGPTIASAAAMLQASASYVRVKAQEQIAASSAGLTGPGSLLSSLLNSPGFILLETAGGVALRPLTWLFGPGADPPLLAAQQEVQQETGRSPADQAAWWNSLSPAQRNELMTLVPGSLLLLGGLPINARNDASRAEARNLESTIAVSTTTDTLTGQVGIGKFGIGADGSWTETRNADGTYTVTLSGDLSGGVGVGVTNAGAGVALDGKCSTSYTFSSQAQVDAFKSGLLKAATPEVGWQDLGYVVPGGATAVVSGQVASYLAGYKGDQTSMIVSGSLQGSANVTSGVTGMGGQAVNLSIQGGAGVQHDMVTGDTTAFVNGTGSAFGSAGPFEGAAAGQVQAAVTWNSSGSLTGLTLSGSYSVEGSAHATPLGSMDGSGGSFQVQTDLSNPANRAAAVSLVAGLQDGNSAQVTAAYQQLYGSSTVIVQHDQVSGTPPEGINAVVVAGSYQSTTTTATSTWVKPADGNFVPLPAGGR
jgi:uncharacterized protein YukE